ncbi:ABC transporter permease [Propionibacterium sp.]|uniref:ABC transporter permease n=1 Tax=Propionibacterium sp. TaxID=1977903 RepID=UPI0039E8702A
MADPGVEVVRPSLGLILRSLLRADFTVLLRSSRTLLLNIAVPIFILVVTSLSPGDTSLLTLGFEVGLALTFGLISSSLIGYSLTVARDREAGVLQRLRVTPAPTWTIMVSRLLVQLVADLALTVVVIVVFSIMHGVTYTIGQYLLVVAVSLLGGAVFLSIGQMVVALVRSAATVNAVGRLLYIVLILLGLLGVSGLLGSTVQTVAQWSPTGAVIELYTVALSLTGWSGADTHALIACIGYVAICSFIGIRWFHWDAHG